MTQVRFANRPATRRFNNLMDDLFTGMPSFLRDDFSPAKETVPVNIKETEQDYQLEVIAPGMEKEDFTVNLDNNLLTISGVQKNEAEQTTDRQVRREYRFQSFKRSFTVDETIDAEAISAKYVNGVLTLNLPKKASVKTSAKQISIQ